MDFETVLQRYPWQKHSSSKYPVCPIENHFNRQLFDYSSGSSPPDSPCHSVRAGRNMSPYASLNDTEDALANCENAENSSNTNCFQGNTAYSFQPGASSVRLSSGSSEIGEATCVIQNGVVCEGIKVDGRQHVKNKKKQRYSSLCSTNDMCPNSVEPLDNLKDPGHFGNIDGETDGSSRKEMMLGHITEDVVEQFKNVLLGAVRRRVFNYSRRDKAGSCGFANKVEGYDCDDEANLGNKPKSYVGILFSGGLDSIVLAALADR